MVSAAPLTGREAPPPNRLSRHTRARARAPLTASDGMRDSELYTKAAALAELCGMIETLIAMAQTPVEPVELALVADRLVTVHDRLALGPRFRLNRDRSADPCLPEPSVGQSKRRPESESPAESHQSTPDDDGQDYWVS